MSPVIIRLRSRSRRLSTRCSRLTVATRLAARLSVKDVPGGRPGSPPVIKLDAYASARLPAASARAPSNDDRHSLRQDRTARRRGARREELAAAADLSDTGGRRCETASSKTHCTRDFRVSEGAIGIARHSEGAQCGARDAVSRVARGWRQRASVGAMPRRPRPASLAKERSAHVAVPIQPGLAKNDLESAGVAREALEQATLQIA